MKQIVNYTLQHGTTPEGQPFTIPAIVDRLQSVGLETVLKNAIDRGLIAGIKESAAGSIAEGIIEQVYKELKDGNGVKFGDFFYVRLYLDGQTDANGTLTDENTINARFAKGPAFALTLDDFSFHYVASEDAPKVNLIESWKQGSTSGTIQPDADVLVHGERFFADDTLTEVVFVKGETKVVVDSFTTENDYLLRFPRPAGLDEGEWKFYVQRRNEETGLIYASGVRNVTVEAQTAVPAPTITAAASPDEADGTVLINGGRLVVEGTNLDTATEVKMYTDASEVLTPDSLWATVPATFADGKLTTDVMEYSESPSQTGWIQVTTAGGSAQYAVTYDDRV